MSTVKKEILSKISNFNSDELIEVELATLGVTVKDVLAAYDELGTIRNEANKYIKQSKDAALGMANVSKTLKVRTEAFLKTWDLFQANVKGLGLEVPSNVAQLGSFAKGELQLANSLSKSADTITKASNL